MVRNCSVPKCNTGFRKNKKGNRIREVSLFSVPKCPELVQKWNNALAPLLEKKLRQRDSVCALHFNSSDIMTHYETVLPDGTVNRIFRGRPGLRPDAVPTIRPQPLESVETIVENEEQHRNETVQGDITFETLLTDSEGTGDENESCADWEEERLSDLEVSFNPEYCIGLLKHDLKTASLPEFWSYARCGRNVLFHLLDPYSHCTKLKLIVDEDMTLTTTLADGTVTKEIESNFKSMEDIIETLRKTTYIKVCMGTEMEEESRDIACPGLIDSENMYKRRHGGKQRCIPCRALRNRLKAKHSQTRSALKRRHTSDSDSNLTG